VVVIASVGTTIVAFQRDVLDRWFQIESLLRFNAKFQPRWITRYVVYRSVSDLAAVAAAALAAEGYLFPPLALPRAPKD